MDLTEKAERRRIKKYEIYNLTICSSFQRPRVNLLGDLLLRSFYRQAGDFLFFNAFHMTRIQQVINTVTEFDAKSTSNEFLNKIEKIIIQTVSEQKPLHLVTFTCSTLQSEYLFSDTPWNYVNRDTKGNNLEGDLPRLNKIVEQLRTIYPTELTILIGNTDPYYIYLQQFKNFQKEEQKFIWEQFVARWKQYKNNLEDWISKTYPTLKPNVVSWYEFETNIQQTEKRSFEMEFDSIFQNSEKYFSKSDLECELMALKKQFGPGKYFTKLECPSDNLLRDWIQRKFTEYALQGQWLYEYFSPSLLIQNEKPSDLRSRMYQPLIQEKYKDTLPIVYFLGVDNGGYQ